MSPVLERAVKIIVQVSKPEKIILFGSRAIDKEHQQSDYDICVLKKDLKNQRALTQQIYLNFHNMGAPIDVILADMDKFERLKNDPYLIYRNVDRTGKVIYEKR